MTHKNTLYRIAALAVVVLVTIGTLCAQKRSFNLGTDYGLTPSDRSVLVGTKFPSGADTVRLPWAWKALKVQGMTYATFRKLTVATAYLNDAAWANEAPGNLGRFQNAFNYLEIPVGCYEVNATCPLPRRGLKGQGSYPYYGENAVTTELIMSATWYAVNGQTERALLCSPNWNDASNMGYNESATVENIALTGPKLDDGVTRIGLALRKFGECTYVNQVRSDWFTYGFVASGGVPLTIGTITAFHNVKGGFVGLGSAGATINIGTLSGDDNAELFGLHPGYGGSAGGIVNIGLLKIETGVTDEARGVWRGMIAAYLDGQFSVNIGVVSGAAAAVRCDALFVVNPSIPAYGPQGAQLTVGSVAHFGYATALQNIQAGTRVASPPPYQAYDIHWNAIQNTFTSTYPGLKSTGCACKDRLGYLRDPAASFDYVACLPVYPGSAGGSNPTPPACAYTYSTWSTCVNGTQTRSVVTSSPSGCVGTPVTTQSCATAPASKKWSTTFDGTNPAKLMTGTAVNATAWTNGNWTAGLASVKSGVGTTGSNTIFPLSITTTRIVLKGATFVKSADYAYLCGQSLDGNAVRVRSNGEVIWSTTGQVLGKLSNIKGDVTIDLPAPLALTYVLGMLNGACPEFTVDGMEIY